MSRKLKMGSEGNIWDQTPAFGFGQERYQRYPEPLKWPSFVQISPSFKGHIIWECPWPSAPHRWCLVLICKGLRKWLQSPLHEGHGDPSSIAGDPGTTQTRPELPLKCLEQLRSDRYVMHASLPFITYHNCACVTVTWYLKCIESLLYVCCV